MNNGWTMKQTSLMSNMYWNSWSLPQTMKEELHTWTTREKQYVSELNNPLAHKIEALLGSLVRLIHKDEARSMKNIVLTDFFQRS
jgi:HPt (histidine-containing phosphotransfer) domain-containing protein